jgi:tRNA pseudouridine55 synthase
MTTPFGILNVDKPAGWTSRDVVNRIEGLVRPAKCGHAGTLDPLATGVLVVCVGRATRLIQYVQQLPKHYRGTFLLGRRSVTDDTEGDVEIVSGAVEPMREAIAATLPQFVGDVEQRPPAHSAIKISGRRAYDLARAGQLVELPPRTVTIHRLEIRRYEYPELELEIECGSGTYVRSLGRDLAAALGTSAVMSALVRTAIGDFCLKEAVPLDELTAEIVISHLQPALAAVAALPRVELTERELAEIRHGRPIAKPKVEAVSPSAEWTAIDAAGELAAILTEKQPGQLWPTINFV